MNTVFKRKLSIHWPREYNHIPKCKIVDDIIEELRKIPNHILSTHDAAIITEECRLRENAIVIISQRYYETKPLNMEIR